MGEVRVTDSGCVTSESHAASLGVVTPHICLWLGPEACGCSSAPRACCSRAFPQPEPETSQQGKAFLRLVKRSAAPHMLGVRKQRLRETQTELTA